MTLQLDDLALFVTIAEAGSLAEAGRTLGLSKATVSRRLNALEAALGVPLFRRSTRALSLTDEGRRRYDAAAPGLHAALAGQAAVRAMDAEPAGLVRLTATSAVGEHLIVPKLGPFLARYSAVQVELILTERRVDLVAEGIDLAVRMGPLDDSDLVVRRLTTVNRIIGGTRSIVEAACLRSPSDLAHPDVPCIVQRPTLTSWRFANGETIRVPWRAAVGTMAAARVAALGSCGLALLPDFVVADDLSSGRLVRALPNHGIEPATASLVAPRTALSVQAVARLRDHLVE